MLRVAIVVIVLFAFRSVYAAEDRRPEGDKLCPASHVVVAVNAQNKPTECP